MAEVTTQVAQQQAPESTPPPPDPEAAQYEALRKELEGVEQPAAEAPKEPAQQPPAAEKTKPTYEELEEHSRRTAGALKEERERSRAQQAQTDAILEALRDARERRAQQKAEAEKAAEPQLPDVQADPIGHFTGRIAQLEEALRKAEQGGQQDSQQVRQHLQEQAMWTAVEASEREIRSQKTDYDDACRHLEGARVKQLDRMYPSDSPQAVALARQHGFANANEYKLSLLDQDRRSVAMHALQTGVSPAQLYYDLALDSGYQPKANGKAQPSAQQADKQIEAMRNGVKAAVTLSGDSGSRKGAQDMSVSDLTRLFEEDPEAADKIWEQMERAGRLG